MALPFLKLGFNQAISNAKYTDQKNNYRNFEKNIRSKKHNADIYTDMGKVMCWIEMELNMIKLQKAKVKDTKWQWATTKHIMLNITGTTQLSPWAFQTLTDGNSQHMQNQGLWWSTGPSCGQLPSGHPMKYLSVRDSHSTGLLGVFF